MRRFLISLVIAVFSATVDARMYQWLDPDSGTTQLSGKPPAWYRSDSSGPRIFVFENGKVIDDTGLSVSEPERDRLRQQAFLQAEEDKSAARDKLMEAKRLEAALGQEQAEEETVVETAELADAAGAAEVPAEEVPPPTEQDTINQMRSLIEEWEANRTEAAKGLVNPAVDP